MGKIGKFYQVWNKGRLLGTRWARSREDLQKQLAREKQPADKVKELR